MPNPAAARAKALVCRRSLAGIVGLIPPGTWCCVLPSRCPCDGPITRPGVPSSVVCLSDLETSIMGRPRPTAAEPLKKSA